MYGSAENTPIAENRDNKERERLTFIALIDPKQRISSLAGGTTPASPKKHTDTSCSECKSGEKQAPTAPRRRFETGRQTNSTRFPFPYVGVCCVSTSMTSFCSCLPCIRPVAPLVGSFIAYAFKSFTVQNPTSHSPRSDFYGPFYSLLSPPLPAISFLASAVTTRQLHRPVVPTA